MSEIEFRVWNYKEKKWIKDFPQSKLTYALNYYEKNKHTIPPQQSTGIKAIDGRVIFEGDFIKVPEDWDEFGLAAGETYEIYFAFGGFRMKPRYNRFAKGYYLEDNNTYEIVGNVCENPELKYKNY